MSASKGIDELRRDNAVGAGLAPKTLAPFAGADEHLRAEMWAVWLSAEVALRRVWQRRQVPGVEREPLERIIDAAHRRFTGASPESRESSFRYGLRARQVAEVASRIEATVRAAASTPLIELRRRIRLDETETAALVTGIAAELDADLRLVLATAADRRLYAGFDEHLLAVLFGEGLRERARYARALSASSRLRLFGLVEQVSGQAFGRAAGWRPTPRMFDWFAGDDAAISPDVAPFQIHGGLDAATVQVGSLARALASGADIVVLLSGGDAEGRRHALEAAREGAPPLLAIDWSRVAVSAPGAAATVPAVVREATLAGRLLYVDVAGVDATAELLAIEARHRGPVIVGASSGQPMPRFRRPLLHIALDAPSRADREILWQRALPDLGEAIETIAATEASSGAIERTAAIAKITGTRDVKALRSLLKTQR